MSAAMQGVGLSQPNRGSRLRLWRPAGTEPGAFGVGLGDGAKAAGLAARACQLLHAGAALSGLLPCLAFGCLDWRPSRARTARGPLLDRLDQEARWTGST